MKIARTIFLVCCTLQFPQFLRAAPPQGYVIQWGWNTAAGIAAPPRCVLSNAVSISAGRLHCLGLMSDGTVVQFGFNSRGEASIENTVLTTGEVRSGDSVLAKNTARTITNGVVKISGRVLTDAISIAAGDQFSLGLKNDGSVVGWGENSMPIGPSNVVAIAAAGFTSVAARTDGTVIQWMGNKGFPGYGQFEEIKSLSNVIAIAIGETAHGTRTLALKSDGRVANWGSQSINMETTPPSGLSNVLAIAVGNIHCLALTRDASVTGWGYNRVGQATGVPTTNSPCISSGQVRLEGIVLTDVQAIAASSGYSMVLKRDGTIVMWGRMVNDLYPAIVPPGLSNVVAIAAGNHYSLAITTNPAVAARFRQ